MVEQLSVICCACLKYLPANGLALLGPRPLEGPVIIKSRFHIGMVQVGEGSH